MDKNLCQIPCGEMPIISQTNFGKAIKTLYHPDRTVNYNVLIYIIHGEMEIFEDGIPYTLTTDTLFFLKSGVHHWGEKAFSPNTSWYYIHFEFPNLMGNYERYDGSNHKGDVVENIHQYAITLPKSIGFSSNNNIKYRIKQIVQNHNSGNVMAGAILLWRVLLDCFESQNNQNHLEPSHIKVKQLDSYLQENFHKKITHEEIQKEIGLSFKYLSELFKETTGKTIKQYQLSLRLKKSVELLSETSLPVGEISRRTGFYDEFYFSKIFKREFGVSPSQYRATYTPKI